MVPGSYNPIQRTQSATYDLNTRLDQPWDRRLATTSEGHRTGETEAAREVPLLTHCAEDFKMCPSASELLERDEGMLP